MIKNISKQEQYVLNGPSIKIENICNFDEEIQKQFTELFKNQLEPLYGSQEEDALRKIFIVKDRTAKVILNDQNCILGILVYKDNPVTEYGINDALEIKTLMFIDPEQNGGKGLGAILIEEAEKVAHEKNIFSYFVTVAEDKQESQQFFLKHGFVIHSRLTNAYRDGNIETIFKKELQ